MGLSVRNQAWLGFGACVLLIAAAYYFQFVEKLEPCPLCIFQRVGVAAVGLVFLISALHNPGKTGYRVYGFLGLLAAGAGGAVSARHIWLLHLPADEVPTCGPGLNYLLDNFPFMKVLEVVFRGSGECAEQKWEMLGLYMPTWVLLAFVVFGLVGLVRMAGR